MPAIKFDTTLMRLIKDMQEVRAALRHVATNLPLYDVANENTPASISTDQNDYVPGNYDVLRVNATANVSITGISGGKKGRFLEIINVGTGRISFPDESASSAASNRIATPYDQTVTLLTNARVRFYYDDTQQRWTVADLPNIQGQFGKYAVIGHSGMTIQTVSAFGYVSLQLDTVISDEWSYWDSVNKKFTIPSGESGLYSLAVSFYWKSSDTVNWGHQLRVSKNVTADILAFSNDTHVGTDGDTWGVNHVGHYSLQAGDSLLINVYSYPFLGTPTRDIRIFSTVTPVLVLSKIG